MITPGGKGPGAVQPTSLPRAAESALGIRLQAGQQISFLVLPPAKEGTVRLRIQGQDFSASARQPLSPGSTGIAVVEDAGSPLRIRISTVSPPPPSSPPKIPVLLGKEPPGGSAFRETFRQWNDRLAAELSGGKAPSPQFLREAIVFSRFLASTVASLPPPPRPKAPAGRAPSPSLFSGDGTKGGAGVAERAGAPGEALLPREGITGTGSPAARNLVPAEPGSSSRPQSPVPAPGSKGPEAANSRPSGLPGADLPPANSGPTSAAGPKVPDRPSPSPVGGPRPFSPSANAPEVRPALPGAKGAPPPPATVSASSGSALPVPGPDSATAPSVAPGAASNAPASPVPGAPDVSGAPSVSGATPPASSGPSVHAAPPVPAPPPSANPSAPPAARVPQGGGRPDPALPQAGTGRGGAAAPPSSAGSAAPSWPETNLPPPAVSATGAHPAPRRAGPGAPGEPSRANPAPDGGSPPSAPAPPPREPLPSSHGLSVPARDPLPQGKGEPAGEAGGDAGRVESPPGERPDVPMATQRGISAESVEGPPREPAPQGRDVPFWFFVPYAGEQGPLLFPGYRKREQGEPEASWGLFFRLPDIGAVSVRFLPAGGAWAIRFEVEHEGMERLLAAGEASFSETLRGRGFPLREVAVRRVRRGSAESGFGAMLSRDTGIRLLEEKA